VNEERNESEKVHEVPPATPATQDSATQNPDSATGEATPRRRRRRRRRRSRDGSSDSPAGAESNPAEGADTGEGAAGAVVERVDGSPSPTAGKRRKRSRKRKPGEAPAGQAVTAAAPRRRREGTVDRRPKRGPTELATLAVRALAAMGDRLLDLEGVPAIGRPRHLEIRLKVPLEAGPDLAASARQVVEQIVARVRDVREHEAALEPGAVYCYFTGSASAVHSRPPAARQVFEGYGSTGRPNFVDFTTLAIERRAEAIDRLVAGEDLIVTSVSMGRVLRTQQLHEFGHSSPVFRILGQVDAGLFPLAGSEERAAFSFQLLRAQTLDGLVRFRLHWVSAADLRDVADPSVASILKRFQQRLDHESLRYQGLDANGKAGDIEEFVQPFLIDLSKQLAGRARRAMHRTDHANERVEERSRPTAKCWDDAREASDDRILRDDEQNTVVVVGPRNRVHVFSRDAKHVTSFVLSGSQVNRRVQEGRWHHSEPVDRGEFRIALKKRSSEPVVDAADLDTAATESTSAAPSAPSSADRREGGENH
jgi:hypothetical protein